MTSTSTPSQCSALSLGTLGTLVHVPPNALLPTTSVGTPAPPPNPNIVFVLDRSASMGQQLQSVVMNTADALRSLGVKECNMHIAAFGIECARFTARSPAALHALATQIPLEGSTRMAPAVPVVASILAELPRGQPVTVLVVSDGDLHDSTETRLAVEGLASRLRGTERPIDVCMVRLHTSSTGNQPDTRALAMFGSLCNTGTTPQLLEVATPVSRNTTDPAQIAHINAAAQTALVGGLMPGLVGRSQPPVSITTLGVAAPSLRTMLTDAPTTKVQLYPSLGAWILAGPAIDDVKTRLVMVTPDGSVDTLPWAPHGVAAAVAEGQILPFLEAQLGQLRLSAVSGLNAGAIDAALDWVQALKTHISAAAAAAAAASSAGAGGPTEGTGTNSGANANRQSMKARVSVIAKAARTVSIGIIDQLLQLRNRGALASLNAAQTADYLRGGLTSTRTAKRVGNMDDVTQGFLEALGALVRDGPKTAASVPRTAAGVAATLDSRSFYSLDTWADAFGALEDLVDALPNMTVEEALPLVGGLGLAIRVSQGDCPDPYGVRVDHVFVGHMLSEPDVIQAFRQGAGEPLYFPGSSKTAEAVVNGVVPLQCANPALYRLYVTTGRLVANMHAGRTIRGCLAPINYDRLALTGASLVKLCCQLGNVGLPLLQAEVAVYTALRRQVADALSEYAAGEVDKLLTPLNAVLTATNATNDVDGAPAGGNGSGTNGIANANGAPVHALSRACMGSNGMSALKLALLWLAGRNVAWGGAADTQAARSVRTALAAAYYDYETYRAVKHVVTDAAGRAAAIDALCAGWGCLLSATPGFEDLLVGPPGSPDVDPPIILPPNDWAVVELPRWMPPVETTACVARFAGTPIPAYFHDVEYTAPAGLPATPVPPLPVVCAVVTDPPELAQELTCPPPLERHQALGCASPYALHVAQVALAVRGIVCPDEQARIAGPETNALPPLVLSSEESCVDYICAAVQTIATKRYETALAQKRHREANAAADALAAELAEASYAEFMYHLASPDPALSSRNHIAYPLLVTRLAAQLANHFGGDLTHLKLWTLATGVAWSHDAPERNVSFTDADAVWGGGLAHNALEILGHLETNGAHCAPVLRQVISSRVAKYRVGSNRHGHDNSNPSYQKRGFASLPAMFFAVSDEEFRAYAAQHPNCCGFHNGVHAWVEGTGRAQKASQARR